MKYALFLAAAIGCCAQNVATLSAEIQRAPTANLYSERAAAYLAAGDARGALADTDRALDKDALNVRALMLRSQANSRLGRFSAAVTDLSGAIALAPADATLYAARSEAYDAVGDQPRALADRKEAARLNPNLVAVLDKKSAPDPVAAVTPPPPVAAPKTLPSKPPVPAAPPSSSAESADSLYQRARTQLTAGKYTEAIVTLNDAIKLQPDNSVLFNTRGYVYYLSRDVKKALADYDEAIKLKPDYLNATHNRALARKAAGDEAGAEADRKREAALTKKATGK